MWVKRQGSMVLERLDRGIDYGTVRVVLARRGNLDLWWKPGYSAWDGRGAPRRYFSARLDLATSTPGEDHLWGIKTQTVFEGRFSKAKIREHASTLAKFLGVPVSDLPALNPKDTYIWLDPPYASPRSR